MQIELSALIFEFSHQKLLIHILIFGAKIQILKLTIQFAFIFWQGKSLDFGAKIQSIKLPVSETNVSFRFPLLTTKSVRSSPTLTTVDMLTS